MGALATARPAPATLPEPPAAGPSADWDRRCEAGFARWPRGLRSKLFRATSGHATAIAICDEIVDRTHGAALRRGARPEWTEALGTQHFAELLNVTVKAVQDAVNSLLELGLIARRTAPNRAFQYQARPWVWEALADANGNAAEAAPLPDDSNGEEEAQADAVRITREPLLVLPGKKSRPVPLSDAVRATLKSVRFENYTGLELPFSAVMDGGSLCVQLLAFEGSEKAKEKRSTAKFASLSSSQVAENADSAKLATRNLLLSAPVTAINEKANEGRRLAKQTSLSAPLLDRIERLRTAVNECFAASIGAPIDDFVLGEIARALGSGSESAFFTRCHRARERKRVVDRGYRLLVNFASDASQIVDTPRGESIVGPSLPDDDGTVWASIREQLRSSIPEVAFDNWFSSTRFHSLEDDGMLRVSVADEPTAEILRAEYLTRIDDAAKLLRTRVRVVEFVIRGN